MIPEPSGISSRETTRVAGERMPYLMHIALDNPFRLKRRVHYFEYKGVRFKLIQNNPRKWSDVLITIVDDYPPNAEAQRAFAAASEFTSALSWEYDVGLALRHVGGPGIPSNYTLRSAKCRVRVFPEIPFRGNIIGFDLSRIAKIDTDFQRKAITLFREAKSSNKVWLSALFYWQILESLGQADSWINKALRRDKELALALNENVRDLPLTGRTVGGYLQEHCRHAIAHIRRHPGKAVLEFDNEENINEFFRSARLLEALAKYYIRNVLGVKETLFLARHRGKGFPIYLDLATIESGWYTGVRKSKRRSLKANAEP
jgi:hypothetical protein